MSVVSIGGNNALVHEEEERDTTEQFGMLSRLNQKKSKELYYSPNTVRINALRERNKMVPPHLVSHYPIETQGRDADKVDTLKQNSSPAPSESERLKKVSGKSDASNVRPLSQYESPAVVKRKDPVVASVDEGSKENVPPPVAFEISPMAVSGKHAKKKTSLAKRFFRAKK